MCASITLDLEFLFVAFRGFGGPQGLLGSETIVEHVAAQLKMDPLIVRRLNMYKEGEPTHFGQPLERWNIPRMTEEILKSSEFFERQKSVEKFNQENIYRKRGICFLPTKFGIAFTAKFLNQAGALVHVYKDGSVLVNHGGTMKGEIQFFQDHDDFRICFRYGNGTRVAYKDDFSCCRSVEM